MKPLSNTEKSSEISSAPLRGDDVRMIPFKLIEIYNFIDNCDEIEALIDWKMEYYKADDVKKRLAWAKSWHEITFPNPHTKENCADCKELKKVLYCGGDTDEAEYPWVCKDCMLDRAFGEALK